MRLFPRTRVLILILPILVFFAVTYLYFRSFSNPLHWPSPFNSSPLRSSPLRSHNRPPPPKHHYPDYSPAPKDDLPTPTSPVAPPKHDNGPINVPVLDTTLRNSRPTAKPDSSISKHAQNTHVVPSGLAPTSGPTDTAETTLASLTTDTASLPGGPKKEPETTQPSVSTSDATATDGAVARQTQAALNGNTPEPKPFPTEFGHHAIDHLVEAAVKNFEEVKKKETHSLEKTAAAYRKRRGRHPPPGFDKWYEFAKQKDVIIIEDFFDPIYEDTEPFWGRKPGSIREDPPTWGNVLTIRKGKTKVLNNEGGSKDWIKQWQDMLKPVIKNIPDMDLAFNSYDEPRVLAPWETINKHMTEARKHKNLKPPNKLVLKYQSLPALSTKDLPENQEKAWETWHSKTYWALAREACHPDSVARGLTLDKDPALPPEFPEVPPEESYQGYVANFTYSRNVCLNPHLRNVHGNFVKPRFASVNNSLFPMFGGSKHEGINNELRVPAARYWSSGKVFGGEDDTSSVDADGPKGSTEFFDTVKPWPEKSATVFWRGSASGGAHTQKNWRRFHRHRFLSMLNSTQVTMTERKLDNMTSLTGKALLKAKPDLPHNFPIPNSRIYPLTALSSYPTRLGEWLEPLTDAAFTHTMCSPQGITMLSKGMKCSYTDNFFSWNEMVPLKEAYDHKYLPDIDGNGYSGRYRAFLRSGSLPIKATVHAEWHDSRLFPWVHFVPMDNTFSDFYGILEYFVGHPDAASESGTENGEGSSSSGGKEEDDDGTRDDGNFFTEWLGWAGGGHDGGGTRGHRLRGGGHDALAQAMAEHGRDWAQRVLRKEDMVVYMFRLMLEWGRITNDRRDDMGWAEDLRQGGGKDHGAAGKDHGGKDHGGGKGGHDGANKVG